MQTISQIVREKLLERFRSDPDDIQVRKVLSDDVIEIIQKNEDPYFYGYLDDDIHILLKEKLKSFSQKEKMAVYRIIQETDPSIEFEDLDQWIDLGITKALRKFTSYKSTLPSELIDSKNNGASLTSYSYFWIFAYLREACKNTSDAFKVDENGNVKSIKEYSKMSAKEKKKYKTQKLRSYENFRDR